MKYVHLALFFKDFAVWTNSSCVGLNVAAYTTQQVLRGEGVDAHVFPVRHNVDVVDAIDKYKEKHGHSFTHVVISAPWLSVHDLKSMLIAYPHIRFVILSHSNVGFLQADPGGVRLLRAYMKLEEQFPNIVVGGNSAKFVEWLKIAYPHKNGTVLLPNLYPLGSSILNECTEETNGALKIGAFGAVRPQKNYMTAAGAALAIHRIMGIPVEFHMSAGGEGDQGFTVPAIEQMLKDVPGVKLIRHKWSLWNGFIKTVEKMDLLVQPSYTESFNMVTADGLSVGVPSVVSSAIDWAPIEWKANADDVIEVALTGIELFLHKEEAVELGVRALLRHNAVGLQHWLEFLKR